MHVGHLRTTVVGDAVVRVLEYLGDKVIRANHIGDWGTQFGMLLEHLLDVGEEAANAQLAAGEINAFYQAAKAKFDADPSFAERSRRRVVALQAGDARDAAAVAKLVNDSKQYYNNIYARLGVTLTDADLAPESFYNSMLADVCDELQAKGVAVISDGALCAFPPGFTGRDGSPLPLILRKSDGGYGYATTDMAAIRYRIRDLHADRIIYVVGAEQAQHFAMVFAVARQAGWLTDAVSAEHAAIGLVTGADRKRFRTRSGGSVKLIDLIDEAVERAEEVIKDRYDDPELRRQIAEAVGIGALKYADLSVARDSGYVLDFDRMLALTGNTGPYLQYATARIRSIFRRAGIEPDERDRARSGSPRTPSGISRCSCSASARRSTRWPRPPSRTSSRRSCSRRPARSPRSTSTARCCRRRGVRPPQQARPVRADPARAADRPGPARHPGARADVAAALVTTAWRNHAVG